MKAMLDTLSQLLMTALDTKERRAQLTMPPEQAVRLIVTTTRGIGAMERVYGDRKSLKLTTAALIDALLAVIASYSVGDRPGRWEPRARKRRPKPGARLNQTRAEAKLPENRSKWF